MKRIACRFVLFFLFALFVSLTSSPLTAQEIVAHRGASYDAPENTLAAFRLAWEQNADAIEADFFLSKDEQIVCLHDKTTERLAPKQPKLTVAKSTAEALRRLDVGSWKGARFAGERIPLLHEVLATIPQGKRIFLEIKCGPEIVPHLQRQLKASKLKPEQVVIICFRADVIAACREAMPQHDANWLTSYKQVDGQWRPASDQVVDTLRETRATGLGSQGNLQVLDADFAKSIRSAKKQLHVWTINGASDARTFKQLGVDSITTDRPAYIRDVLSEK